MKIVSFLLLLLVPVILAAGCADTSHDEAVPAGRGYVNLCASDPARADYWQRNDDTLWSAPGGDNSADRTTITRFPSCGNVSVTIWEDKPAGSSEWSHVTLHTSDGKAYAGWLETHHILVSNETGTEWSKNYPAIIGLWDRTGQGNGAKIWYDFKTDGTFTFNYDMRGNKGDVQDMGTWEYLGNTMYRLVSNVSNAGDPGRNRNITINQGRTFVSGTVFSSDSEVGRDIVYAKE